MYKETKFIKYFLLLTPWFCAAITAILYVYIRFIFDYTYFDHEPDPKYINLYEKFGGIVFAFLFLWFGSIFFTLFFLIDFFYRNKTKKRWQELTMLLSGHLAYFLTFNSEIFGWFID